MTVLARYEKADGEAVPFPEREDEMSPMQRAFIHFSRVVGMRRLDSSTIDEFVRRIELHQTYVVSVAYDENGPVVLGRKDMQEMLGDYVAAWTVFGETSRTKFDAAMAKEKAAHEASVARRKGEG